MGTSTSIQNKTKKVKKYLRLLEKKIGRPYNPWKKSMLDQVVFYHILWFAGNSKAKKVLREFKEEYVDWNEVRVSSLGQIGETVIKHDISPEAAPVIKGFLNQIFKEHNSLNLEFLRDEQVEYYKKFFNKVDGFLPGTVDYLAIINREYDAVPIEIPTRRITERIGLLPRSATKGKIKKAFRSIISEKEVFKFFVLSLEHARTCCTPESPLCASCPMDKDCDYALKEKRRRQRRKEREQRKKKAKQTRAKPAVKKTASTAQKKKKRKRRLTRRNRKAKR
jgi:endonuclease-3